MNKENIQMESVAEEGNTHHKHNYDKIKLFIATPCYGGVLYKEYVTGLLGLNRFCFQKKIEHKLLTLANESLVTKARNVCVKEFLDDKDNYTHLLFIDADIGFTWENVHRLIDFDKDICTGIYPKKSFSWQDILANGQRGSKSPDNLRAESLNYTVNVANPNDISFEDGFIETLAGATGMMLIKREVFDKMKKSYPELKYNHKLNGKTQHSENSYLFFDCMKDKNNDYLSEDITFCKRWRDIGGKIYSDISMPLTHVGTYTFKGHIGAKFNRKE